LMHSTMTSMKLYILCANILQFAQHSETFMLPVIAEIMI
jgi:hypothetical protein